MRFRGIRRRLTAAIANWFCSLSPFGKIVVFVFFAHSLLLICFSINHLATPRQQIKKPIAIRTHKPLLVAPKVAPTPKKAAPKKAPLPKQQKKTVPVPKKKGVAPSKPTPLKPPPQKKAPDIHIPAPLVKTEPLNPTLTVEQPSTPSYGHILASFLQESLQLPEIGNVKVRIILEAPGQIASIEILDSKSSKNADWLKNQLPRLSIPCFNDFSISDAKLEFTIVFRNVEKA